MRHRLVALVVVTLGIAWWTTPSQVAAREPGAAPRWDLSQLSQPPATHPAPEIQRPDVRSLYYDALPYHGQPTRVFAFVGLPEVAPGQKVPGMVLIHGGGGTAFDTWVKLWNERGYAAISMDLCGCLPTGKVNNKGKWQRHEQGGPPGWGGFEQIDEPAEDQWTYHAVADALLAHSLLRGLPEVDASRIGVTGISWGGYLTSIVAGVDPRFRFAVPVYGCGYLGDNSTWLPVFEKMTPQQRARWLGWWDPSVYLKNAKLPMLWVNGTNDFAYPMDSWQKSYRTAPGKHWLALRLRMPHGHGAAGEKPEEIRVFADQHLTGGRALPRITGQGRDGNTAWARFESPVEITGGELLFTKDTGKWQQRTWEAIPAALDAQQHRLHAEIPAGTKVYYLNVIDERKCVASSEHVVVAGD